MYYNIIPIIPFIDRVSVIVTSTVTVTSTNYSKDHLELSQIIGPHKMRMTSSAGLGKVSKGR